MSGVGGGSSTYFGGTGLGRAPGVRGGGGVGGTIRTPGVRPPGIGGGVGMRVGRGVGGTYGFPGYHAPGPSGPPVVGGGAHPTPAVLSPLDSTYFQGLNNATFNATNKINGYNQAQGYATIDEQNALDQLAHQQPIDTLNDQQKYNRQGLLYSGHLGQSLGELNRGYLDRQSALQTGLERSSAARDAAIAAVQGGLSLEKAALYAQAVDRASSAAAHDPTLGVAPSGSAPTVPGSAPGGSGSGVGTGNPGSPGPPPPGSARGSRRGGGGGGVGGTYSFPGVRGGNRPPPLHGRNRGGGMGGGGVGGVGSFGGWLKGGAHRNAPQSHRTGRTGY